MLDNSKKNELINIEVASSKTSEDDGLTDKKPSLVAPSIQMILDLGVEVQKAVHGIEMGILENGVPFLTQRGLADAVGVARNAIFTLTQEWEEHFHDEVLTKDRISFLKDHLFAHGYKEPKLYIETVKDGVVNYAYPDLVCMAIMEYYAFEAKKPSEKAIKNYRMLAAYGFRKFVYEALEYVPQDKWKYYQDRVSILKDSSPDGHFILFNEVTGLLVDLITADLTVNHKTIPDISVGIAWGKYWSDNSLDGQFKSRIKFEHNYPDYYPQAVSNPQTPWAYPDEALPLFRRWFKNEYLPTKFPKYILTKANVLKGGTQEAQRIASLYQISEIKQKKA